MTDLVDLPRSAALNYIGRIFVRHDGIKHADAVLQAAVTDGLGVRLSYVGYVKGYSRCGKTETTKRFIERLTGVPPSNEPIQVIEGRGHRVLFVEVVTGATVLGLSQAILRHFSDLRVVGIGGDIKSRGLREQDAARRLVEVLPLNDIDIFVLDEFQNLCRSSSLSPRLAAASFLITIQNGRVCPVVVTGTNQLDDIFAAEDALDKRKGGLAYLAPFALRTEADKKLTRTFVRQFTEKLPFKSTCDLYSDDEMLLRTFFAFRGPPGVFAKLCEEAAKAAFGRQGAGRPDKLTIGDFADGFDFFLKHDRQMLGVNPFRAKKLPNIPLSIDKPMPFDTEKRTGSGQVRTLIDG